MIFIKDFETGLKDVRTGNKITNKAILEIFEDVAAKHADSVGDGLNDLKMLDNVWIILDWKVKIIKRPIYGQTLNVLTWGRDVRKCYIYRDFELYDDENNLCAIATSKWVSVNMQTRKIVRIEQERIDKYGVEFCNEVFKNEKLEKIEVPQKFENSMEYKVYRRDIDVNNHMHNLYYLDLAYEVLPEEVYKNKIFDDIRIMYKKEIILGESVECRYSYKDGVHTISIVSDEGNVLHAVIELTATSNM